MKTIEQIRDAFHLIHRVATGQSDRGYMSIPADPERDADLIVAAAIDELEALRAERDALKAEKEQEWQAHLAEKAAFVSEVASLKAQVEDKHDALRLRNEALENEAQLTFAALLDLRRKTRDVLEHALLNVRALTGGDEKRMRELLNTLPKETT